MFEDLSYEKNHFVTKKEAVYRKAILSDIHYSVSLALPKGDIYLGHSKITFSLDGSALANSRSHPVSLDFRAIKICDVHLNGKQITSGAIFTNHQVHLPADFLKQGANELSLNYYNKYRKDGVGLHSFTDSVDGEQYLYT